MFINQDVIYSSNCRIEFYSIIMFRSIPVANKICFDKDLKRQWRIHEKKIKDLKCTIDFKEPQSFDFLASKLKKEEIMDIRNAEIMRENQVLLSKISNITIQGSISKQLKKCKSVPHNKTLNEPFRRKYLEQISQENQSMLKRIQDKKSCYDSKKMAKQRLDVQKNIHLISYFPYKDLKKNKTQVNLWMTNEAGSVGCRQVSQSQSMDNIPNEVKKTRKIGKSFFLITCFHVNHKFNIQMQNLESSQQKYHLQMDESQASSFLRNYFQNSIDRMLNALSIDEKDKVCYLKYNIKEEQKGSSEDQTQPVQQ